MVKAGATSPCTSAHDRLGQRGRGTADEISPKRLPMVSTSNPPRRTSSVHATSATNGAGIVRFTFGHRSRMARPTAETAMADGLALPALRAKAIHFSAKSVGTGPIRSPSRSFTWLLKMMTAMPLVNPVTSGAGMNLMAAPSRATPKPIRMAPARKVATDSPSMPYRWTMPYTRTTNAPVGPPICTRLPPSALTRKPATTAVYSPAAGGTPLAMAKAMDSGSATMPTMTPAVTSAPSWRRS
jgi:hypothetical protein